MAKMKFYIVEWDEKYHNYEYHYEARVMAETAKAAKEQLTADMATKHFKDNGEPRHLFHMTVKVEKPEIE